MRSSNHFKNIILILIGTAIYSFGLVHFNMQNNLAEGGFTGITLLLFFLFSFNPSISNLLLNIPVFLIGWKILGRTVFIYTIIGTVGLSLFLELFQRYEFELGLENDLMLVALFAGIFAGTGLGIIFRCGGTTGGSDIVARLVNKFFGWPIGNTMFLFDALVIVLSLLTYLSIRNGIYTLVAVFIGAKIIDFIEEGSYSGRGAFIISDKRQEIANKITSELDRGVTSLKGQGYFSKEDKNVLFCVVAKNQMITLKNLVTSIDPHAFVSITHMNEVIGEGFTLDENKKPIK